MSIIPFLSLDIAFRHCQRQRQKNLASLLIFVSKDVSTRGTRKCRLLLHSYAKQSGEGSVCNRKSLPQHQHRERLEYNPMETWNLVYRISNIEVSYMIWLIYPGWRLSSFKITLMDQKRENHYLVCSNIIFYSNIALFAFSKSKSLCSTVGAQLGQTNASR